MFSCLSKLILMATIAVCVVVAITILAVSLGPIILLAGCVVLVMKGLFL